MIIFPPNVSERPIGRWQSALEVNASLSRLAIFGIRLYECFNVSRQSFLPHGNPIQFLR